MNLIELINLNLLIITVSLIVCNISIKNLNKKFKYNTAFIKIECFTLIMILLENVVIIANKCNIIRPELINTIKFLMIILAPILSYLSITFAEQWIKKNYYRKNKKEYTNMILLSLNCLICIILYSKTGVNTSFVNENALAVPKLLCEINIIYFVGQGIKKLRQFRELFLKYEFMNVYVLMIAPAIINTVNLIFNNMISLWTYMAGLLIIGYLFLRDYGFYFDILTGAYNRIFLEKLNQNIKSGKLKNFSVIFIDLNKFKEINDTFGHNEGDKALKITAALLKKSIKSLGYVIRYGGDEFIILLKTTQNEKVISIINSTLKIFKNYNLSHQNKYNINFSYGWEIYTKSFLNLEECINLVDTNMYINKKTTKKEIN